MVLRTYDWKGIEVTSWSKNNLEWTKLNLELDFLNEYIYFTSMRRTPSDASYQSQTKAIYNTVENNTDKPKQERKRKQWS